MSRISSTFRNVHVVFCIVAALPCLCFGHSYFAHPLPYNTKYNPTNCGGTCPPGCPVTRDGDLNSASNPAAVYKRGETMTVCWARNNHHGGFARISLVPVEKMMNEDDHDRLAIYYGCYEQNLQKCDKSDPKWECGTDQRGEVACTSLKVSHTPDGDYVLGYTWFGGLHWQRQRGQFSNWVSCSFIRIEGGEPLAPYQPFYDAGDMGRYQNGDLCQTVSTSVGQCTQDDGCGGESFWAMPDKFSNGRMPPAITPSEVARGTSLESTAAAAPSESAAEETEDATSPPPVTMPVEQPVSESTTKVVPEPTPEPEVVTVATTAPTASTPSMVSRSTLPSEEESDIDRGVCKLGYCCATSCGSCGGSGCWDRPGGKDLCCKWRIKEAGVMCSETVGAPCIEST